MIPNISSKTAYFYSDSVDRKDFAITRSNIENSLASIANRLREVEENLVINDLWINSMQMFDIFIIIRVKYVWNEIIPVKNSIQFL